MARRSWWRPWTFAGRAIAPLLTGRRAVMAVILLDGRGRQGATGELAEQHGDPPAGRRRQPRPGHDRRWGSLSHGAARSSGPGQATPPGSAGAAASPQVALQTSLRGRMENRIKECQLDLFAGRASAATMRANQLRLWFASMAYVLLYALRRIGLAHTQFAEATCGIIRIALLKVGALVRLSVRRIRIAMASAHPHQAEFALAHARLAAA